MNQSTQPPSDPLVSIVVPVFDERDNLPALLTRLRAAADTAGVRTELLLVDDGSRDGSAEWLATRAASDQRVRVVSLSRNFGHQAALLAGIDHARGDAVITLDGDLQHPPELIPALIERWHAGFEVVQAIRRQPADTSALKRASSRGFYRLLSVLTRLQVTPGAADFRLMARPAVDAFRQCRERCRFNRGLVQWIGFAYTEVPFDADPRTAGRSKYSLHDMLRLAGDAIFSFSSWPLRLAGLAGVSVSLAAMAYLLFALWARLFTSYALPGWTSILATVLVLGGAQLIVLWIMGEYIGRLYEEVKQRPIYIVRSEPAQRPIMAGPATSAATAITSRQADQPSTPEVGYSRLK